MTTPTLSTTGGLIAAIERLIATAQRKDVAHHIEWRESIEMAQLAIKQARCPHDNLIPTSNPEVWLCADCDHNYRAP